MKAIYSSVIGIFLIAAVMDVFAVKPEHGGGAGGAAGGGASGGSYGSSIGSGRQVPNPTGMGKAIGTNPNEPSRTTYTREDMIKEKRDQ
ncbi:MAG: hypothetical protein AB2689_18925, partial [Candidatus Thiodiazotropha taylori]